jgi:hypothetical protein
MFFEKWNHFFVTQDTIYFAIYFWGGVRFTYFFFGTLNPGWSQVKQKLKYVEKIRLGSERILEK